MNYHIIIKGDVVYAIRIKDIISQLLMYVMMWTNQTEYRCTSTEAVDVKFVNLLL